jgi:acetylornithine deacetylase/succinyl-diaminopimelate desuccinylase-like protein
MICMRSAGSRRRSCRHRENCAEEKLWTEIWKKRQDLARLVAIPSISAHQRSLPEGAELVAELLKDAGFVTSIEAGEIAPFVVGEIGNGPLTVVVYNHYDVQPEGDISAWSSPPFELVERDGHWFGRGVADDKGEFVSRLVGWRRFRAGVDQPLPFRLIWIVDGEEEIGSPSLEVFLAKRFPNTTVDACWWEFGEVDTKGRPIVLCGFKGIAAVELRSRTANSDLHSSHGAVFDNAAWRICSAVASMRDERGRVTIDGFYDDVRAPGPAELAGVADSPFSIDELSAATGGRRLLSGVDGSNFYAAMNYQPCLT